MPKKYTRSFVCDTRKIEISVPIGPAKSIPVDGGTETTARRESNARHPRRKKEQHLIRSS